MADAVTTRVLADTKGLYGVHFMCISDGTGETLALKINKSALLGTNGVASGGAGYVEAVALDLRSIRWHMAGFTSLRWFWDHATDDLCWLCIAPSGADDVLHAMEDEARQGDRNPVNKDPKTADSTGNLLLTTVGASVTALYDVVMWFRKRT
jgi:hypothetical protein